MLERVLRGDSNKVIALQLGVTEQLVKEYVSDLFRKFGVPNRAALGVAGAYRNFVGPTVLDQSWIPQLFRTATVQIAVTRGPTHLYVAVNASFTAAVGRDVVGQTMREAFPELAGSGHFEVADRVYQTGDSFVGHEAPASFDRGTGIRLRYIDAVVQALRGQSGAIEGLVYFGIDVTEHVSTRTLDRPPTVAGIAVREDQT